MDDKKFNLTATLSDFIDFNYIYFLLRSHTVSMRTQTNVVQYWFNNFRIKTNIDEHRISSFIIDDFVIEKSKLERERERVSRFSPVASTAESQMIMLRTFCDRGKEKFLSSFCH